MAAKVSIRQKLITAVTFLAGVYFFLEFLLPASLLAKVGVTPFVHERISTGFIVVGTMAFGLGIINLVRIHGAAIVFKRSGWVNSLALLLGLVVMFSVATADWMADQRVSKKSASVRLMAQFAERIIEDEQARVTGSLQEELPPLSKRVNALISATKERVASVSEEVTSLESFFQSQSSGAEASLQEARTSNTVAKLRDSLQRMSVHVASLEAFSELNLNNITTDLQGVTQEGMHVSQLYAELLREEQKSGLSQKLWELLFTGLYESLGAAMFSLLGIYIASAAYRAFRIRSFESALMMTAAILVMLGQIPFGVWIYSGMPDIRLWLLEVPNSAAFRAIKIGSAVAGLVMAFRMWLSLESDYSEEGGV